MKKALTIFLLSLLSCYAMAAQESKYKFDFGAGAGMSGYLGDANTSSLLKHPGFTGELSARYIANVRWAFRAVAGVTSLSGNTAEMENYLPGGAQYDFTSTVGSLDLRAEFNFFPYGIGESYKKLRRISPYLVVGVGACLASSEGNTTVMPTLPMGMGVKYKIHPRLNLGLEFTMTKCFGDKLDGPVLNDLTGIKTSFVKNTDWFSRLTIGISYEFGERCEACNYKD